MAARRLLVVMLVLLGVSTLAAALVPTQKRGADTDATTSTQPETQPPEEERPGGQLLAATIDADAEPSEVVPIEVGDQLSLQVRSKRSDQIEIPAFGLTEPVSPAAPALFDLLPEKPGTFQIRFVEANRAVAEIRVRARSRAREGRPGSTQSAGRE